MKSMFRWPWHEQRSPLDRRTLDALRNLAEVMRDHPCAILCFDGGSTATQEAMKSYLLGLGVESEQVRFERRSDRTPSEPLTEDSSRTRRAFIPI